MLTVCIVSSADTAECVYHLARGCAVESNGELVRRRFMTFNMVISSSHL